jgi:hypothetical protein
MARREWKRRKGDRILEEFADTIDAAGANGLPQGECGVPWPAGLSEPWLLPDEDATEVSIVEGRGRGVIAKHTLAPGVTIAVCKALAIAFDKDEDETSGDDDDNDLLVVDDPTARLVLELVGKLKKTSPVDGMNGNLAEVLSRLWPRNLSELNPNVVSVKAWRCRNAKLQARMHHALASLPRSEGLRLPEIVRSNAMGVCTNSEQLCHFSAFRRLSGVALYDEGSFFNHSCAPNVSRYFLGDWAVFRTNQVVPKGEELCISYIEADLLCERAAVRQCALNEQHKSFQLSDNISDDEGSEGSVPHTLGEAAESIVTDSDEASGNDAANRTKRITEDIQRELMGLPPHSRIEEIDAILEDTALSDAFLETDHRELYQLKAIAWGELGEPENARQFWSTCLKWTQDNLPPADESIIFYGLHVAMCELALNREEKARKYIAEACRVHSIAFGGDAFWFALRYRKELLEHVPSKLPPNLRLLPVRVWGIIAGATERFRQFP